MAVWLFGCLLPAICQRWTTADVYWPSKGFLSARVSINRVTIVVSRPILPPDSLFLGRSSHLSAHFTSPFSNYFNFPIFQFFNFFKFQFISNWMIKLRVVSQHFIYSFLPILSFLPKIFNFPIFQFSNFSIFQFFNFSIFQCFNFFRFFNFRFQFIFYNWIIKLRVVSQHFIYSFVDIFLQNSVNNELIMLKM